MIVLGHFLCEKSLSLAFSQYCMLKSPMFFTVNIDVKLLPGKRLEPYFNVRCCWSSTQRLLQFSDMNLQANDVLALNKSQLCNIYEECTSAVRVFHSVWIRLQISSIINYRWEPSISLLFSFNCMCICMHACPYVYAYVWLSVNCKPGPEVAGVF